MPVHAQAVLAPKQPLQPFEYEPGPLGPHEVEIRVSHCGVCHSDIAMVDNEWGMSQFPLVPGHEAIGTVEAVGDDVTGLKAGQRVGLGWQSGSCGVCEWCHRGKEHLCAQESNTIVGRHGGWADSVRADARFAVPIPEEIPSEFAGPLMCAGSTVFTPLLHHGVSGQMRTAVVGIGGLGHLGIQYMRALGCDVTAISSTHSKEEEARGFGASHFIATKDEGALAKAANSFDFILSTVSADLPWDEYIAALRPEGVLCIPGIPQSPVAFQTFGLILREKNIYGGRTGSPADMASMLSFSARHGVRPKIEQFPLAEVNRALDHVRAEKARYRAVLVV